MKVEITHQLEVAEAVRRMKALTAYWRAKYAIEVSWTTTAATLCGAVLGRSFNATIAVDRKAISLDGPDPGILLRRAAAAYLTGKLDEYLRADPRASEDARRPPATDASVAGAHERAG